MDSVSASPQIMPAFPKWLDLPEGYLVPDWIRLEKGRVIARHLRQNPQLLEIAKGRLEGKMLPDAHQEWSELLRRNDVFDIAQILEATDGEGQRLRSSMPFTGEPFISRSELESIHERAYAG